MWPAYEGEGTYSPLCSDAMPPIRPSAAPGDDRPPRSEPRVPWVRRITPLYELFSLIARDHYARTAVCVIFVLAVTAAFGLPADYVLIGAWPLVACCCWGGLSASRLGLKEPDEK
jgi:hypothetical protein